MNFRVCALCGHIFNAEFDYFQIPYEEDSNLMYNRGPLWTEHMEALVDMLVSQYGAAGKTLLDIGCGDGLFLKILLDRDLGCRCVGFEPGIEADRARANGLEVYRDYFHPERDLKRIEPDVLVCRHVLEHLQDPRSFVASIAYWCNRYDRFPLFLAEVPRIDKAVCQGRATDFLYEHVSNFTQFSFRTLFETTGFEVVDLLSCYGDEVAVAVVRAQKTARTEAIRRSSEDFRTSIAGQMERVGAQLETLLGEGKSVAFWGGAGKGAAFLNTFGITAERFPIVVDSDRAKLGRFVPGTAQEIRGPEHLRTHPVDVIVITTRWRARDIFQEIEREGIRCRSVLVLDGGELRPYAGEEPWESGRSVRVEMGHQGVKGPISGGRVTRSRR